MKTFGLTHRHSSLVVAYVYVSRPSEPRSQVVEVVAATRGEDPALVAAQLWKNACNVFFPHEDNCTGVY